MTPRNARGVRGDFRGRINHGACSGRRLRAAAERVIVIPTDDAMKWYRRMYFKTFEWYREAHGAQSWPESYAAGILGGLHALNLVALAFALNLPISNSALPHGMAGRLLVASLLVCIPPMLCAFRAKQIEAEFNVEEEVAKSSGRIQVALYGLFSVAAVIAAIAFRVAGSELRTRITARCSGRRCAPPLNA